jgi:hypothetical protein
MLAIRAGKVAALPPSRCSRGMWQSKDWNGVPSAFRFAITIIAVLIFVAMPDHDLDR